MCAISSADWAGQNAICVSVCLDVNQGGTNRSRCTQRLVVLHAQTYTEKRWSHVKNCGKLVRSTLPLRIVGRKQLTWVGIFEPHSRWDACIMNCWCFTVVLVQFAGVWPLALRHCIVRCDGNERVQCYWQTLITRCIRATATATAAAAAAALPLLAPGCL